MQSDAFDVIPYEDIRGDWKKLGSGSFGNVYKGTYLGIDVAIKEVLPSNDYDVAKYFEREWRLMKEARHPNVVLYLGLSRAPDPDGRIFIISEFIENGNLRGYIHNQSKPFPWHLRLSFAIDITRALAYLHARKCIHRDLKGENLLVTANGRLKITDFGFARIAARNQDESKRLTFCGTDSYMSPEILLGEEFDLPTDIFSLGIIFCEISSRKLADDHHFKRSPPGFGIDVEEVRQLVSPSCPPAFLALCLECLAGNPSARPTTRVILDKLRDIEADILTGPSEGISAHVGSVKFMSNAVIKKKPGAGPRIPDFGVGIGNDIRSGSSSSADESDGEVMGGNSETAKQYQSGQIAGPGILGQSVERLLDSSASTYSNYSTTIIRAQPTVTTSPPSSILTVRPLQHSSPSAEPTLPPDSSTPTSILSIDSYYHSDYPPCSGSVTQNPSNTASLASIDTFHTANSSSIISTAAATEGGSTIRTLPLMHRFTLIKPGTKRASGGDRNGAGNLPGVGRGGESGGVGAYEAHGVGWNPLDLFFSSGLLMSKCDICMKRLGWKPMLECDDCGLRVHTKCGEVAPRDCGVRPARPGVHHALHAISPLSKIERNAKVPAPPSE